MPDEGFENVIPESGGGPGGGGFSSIPPGPFSGWPIGAAQQFSQFFGNSGGFGQFFGPQTFQQLLGSLIGRRKIPGFAYGGIVNRPTLAMIGEAGPEAVVPLQQPAQPAGGGLRGIAGQLGRGGNTQNPFGLDVKYTPPAVGLNLLWRAFSGMDPNYGGLFSPMGFQPYNDLIREQGMQDAGARANSARLQVQSQGGDPALQAYGSLMANLMGQSDTARLLGQSQLQQMGGAQDFYRNLLMQLLGGSTSLLGQPKKQNQFPINIGLPGLTVGGH